MIIFKIKLKIIILIIIIILKFVKSYDIFIDYKSNIDYINFQCGGEINNNNNNNNNNNSSTVSYPPCKSFFDAGNRIREINITNQDINLNIYINNGPNEIKEDDIFGIISNFSIIEIKSLNYNVSIDGSVVKNSLISISTTNNNSKITINNIIFKNWINNSIFNLNGYSIYFNNIQFFNSSNIVPDSDGVSGSLLSFNNSIFTNISILNQIKFSFKNIIFNNCNIFNNSFNGFVFNNANSTSFNNCNIVKNNIISANLALIQLNDVVVSTFTNLNLSENTITFSIISIRNSFLIVAYLNINNFIYTNNLVNNSPENFYFFRFTHYYNTLQVNFENFQFLSPSINSAIQQPPQYEGIIYYTEQHAINNFNNVYTNYSFVSIFSVNNSTLSITNSSIPSDNCFIKGNNNKITTINSTLNTNSLETCNILNNVKGDCKNSNTYTNNSNGSNQDDSNKDKITIIVLVVVLSSITLLVVLGIIIYFKRKSYLIKRKYKERKKRREERNGREIEGYTIERPTTDNEYSTAGPTFLNEFEEQANVD